MRGTANIWKLVVFFYFWLRLLTQTLQQNGEAQKMIEFECSQCGKGLKFPDGVAGMDVKCLGCGKIGRLPVSSEGKKQDTISVECLGCGKVLNCKAANAGRQGKCPECGTIIRVSASGTGQKPAEKSAVKSLKFSRTCKVCGKSRNYNQKECSYCAASRRTSAGHEEEKIGTDDRLASAKKAEPDSGEKGESSLSAGNGRLGAVGPNKTSDKQKTEKKGPEGVSGREGGNTGKIKMTKCPYCLEDIRYGAVKCRYCGEFASEISKTTQTEKAVPVKKHEIAGAGCLLQAVGLAVFFFFPIGTFLGMVLLVYGGIRSRFLICGRCGIRLSGKTLKLCTSCGAEFPSEQPRGRRRKPRK